MKLRKFEAPSVREALLKVKEELGPDAVILRTEKSKKGVLGGDDVFEVTAAIDENAPPPTPAKPVVTYSPPKARPVLPEVPSPAAYREKRVEGIAPSAAESSELIDMVKELRRELRQIKGKLNRDQAEGKQIPEEFLEMVGEMQEKGFQNWAIQDLVSDLIISQPLDKRSTAELNQCIRELLPQKIQCKQCDLTQGRGKVLLFVGPTGVGKSTSIAKLAAREVLSGNHEIAIISTDAYRIGALEQMELFSRAAEVEFRAVFDNTDIEKALEDFAEKRLILVDTAGRSREHLQHMEELLEVKELLLPDEVHLVVSASTRDRDLEDVVNRFAPIGLTQILFSKVDETLEMGVLYNIPQRRGLPISYLCNGQNIPDDLHNANPQLITDLILKGRF